jgi:hypothetical protein
MLQVKHDVAQEHRHKLNDTITNGHQQMTAALPNFSDSPAAKSRHARVTAMHSAAANGWLFYKLKPNLTMRGKH